ncbi:MAG: hypothetical protein KY476_00685 [Planctomycetes bacterium]|nr:hypothetical protein [Planctomycetota bacterium]
MAAPYLGGLRITKAQWVGTHDLLVRFSSTYVASYHYQLYAGRTRVAVTTNPNDRTLLATLKPSVWPQHLWLLAVALAERLTDYGSALPLRPYNVAELTFSTSTWPADSEFIDITAGTVPGGAVDPANLLERILFDTTRQYSIRVDPRGPSGTWNFKPTGRDNRPPAIAGDEPGNLGTALAFSQELLTHPQDVVLDDDGHRFGVSVAGGTATLTYTLPD